MVGFQVLHGSADQTTFVYSVRTINEKLFDFLAEEGLGGANPRVTWKDLRHTSASIAPNRFDALLAYIDIPIGGGLQFVKGVNAANQDLTIRIIGFELTKNALARILLGTDTETISYFQDGSVSLGNVKPNYALQGGK